MPIERQTQEYAGGDINQHSIITMMTVHDQANVATLQLFDDEISLDAGHLYLNSESAEFGGNIVGGGDITDGNGHKLSKKQNTLLVAAVNSDNQSFAKSAATEKTVSCARSGYTPIGIVGFDIDNASSSGVNVASCVVLACRISGTNIVWQIKNNATAAAKIMLKANVLYKQN